MSVDFATREKRYLALLLIAGFVAVVSAAAWYYRAEQKQLTEEARNQLAAIADLKSKQVAAWREERLGDGRILFAMDSTLAIARKVLAGTGDQETERRALTELMRAFEQQYHYVKAALVDSAGRVRLAYPPLAAGDSTPRVTAAAEPTLSESALDPRTGSSTVSVDVPILDGANPIGALVFTINAQSLLLPLRSWPGPSRTAEILFLQRESDSIAYLSGLRHGDRAVLKLRKSSSDSGDAVIRALSSASGVSEGIDYRGARVLAAVRPVPESSWLVVAKIDQDEVNAPRRRLAWQIVICLALVLIAKATGIALLWRNQQLASERRQQQAELERKALVGHFNALGRYASDIIILLDGTGRVIEANERAQESYGYSEAEFRKLTIGDIRDAATLGNFEADWNKAQQLGGACIFEAVHRRRDGATFPVEISAGIITIEGRRFRQGIIRDITARKTAEAELQRATRALRVLSQANSAIVRSASERELLDNVCELVVRSGGYRLCWAGAISHDAAFSIRPVAVSGDDQGYLAQANISWAENERGAGPAGRAARTGNSAVCRDILNDPAMAPWRASALSRGFASLAAFPLVVNREVEGTLTIYAAEPDAFDARELALLAEVAEDVGFGVGVLRRDQALRDSETKFRTVFDSAGDSIIIHDASGTLIDVNQVACEMLGYDRQELMSLPLSSIDDGGNGALIARRIEAICRDGRLLFDTVHVRKDGSRVPVEVNSKTVEYCGRAAILSVVRDLSERLRAQREIERSESKLVSAQALASVGDWELEAPGPALANPVTVHWSREVYRILGMEPGDAAPSLASLLERVHPDDREAVKLAIDRAFSAGRPFELEHRIVRPNGALRWVRERGDLQSPPGSPARVAGTMQDITEYHRLEEQFQQSQKLESIGRLAGGIAHDFNNLLTVINGYSHILTQSIDKQDPIYDQLAEIERAGVRATELTSQLLTFSRKQVIQPNVSSINSVILEAQKMLARMVGEDIELTTKLTPEDAHALVDRGQMHQVLMNLAVNARDAMPGGGRLILETGCVSLSSADIASHFDMKPGEYVQLSVTDNGTGIEEEVRKHIFEPFFTTKEQGHGTGLGLSTVYGIVKQSGGSIGVYSEIGRGTTFKIYLPRVDGQVDVVPAPVDDESLRGNETILVVEDQPEVRKLAAGALRSYGYRVLEAANGGEALLICEQYKGRIELMLTDVIMPSMLGTTLAQRLETIRPSLRVLYMSGYTAEAIVRDGVLPLDVAYLSKPFTPEQLARKVRTSLARKGGAISALVVDDDDSVRTLLSQVLADAGYRVLQASNGKEALKRLDREAVDVLVTDLVMPETEGIEMVGRLHRQRPDLKIIAISGAFGGEFLRTARVLGAHATLPKPVSPEDLLRTVEQVLTLAPSGAG